MSHEDSFDGDEEEALDLSDPASRSQKLESPSGAMDDNDDDGDDDDAMESSDTLESYAKIGRILNVTIPAILLNGKPFRLLSSGQEWWENALCFGSSPVLKMAIIKGGFACTQC